jgi:hypothetical protein
MTLNRTPIERVLQVSDRDRELSLTEPSNASLTLYDLLFEAKIPINGFYNPGSSLGAFASSPVSQESLRTINLLAVILSPSMGIALV